MSAKTITKDDADSIWENYHNSMKELEGFEQQVDSKKRDIIQSIRDCVDRLVLAGAITIRRDQVAIYVWNKLHERNIKYSRGHFYDIFSDEQKGNYSKSSQGNNHQHTWNLISKNKEYGKWETCECGINKINGILQEPVEQSDDLTPAKLSEIITPEGIEFEVLDKLSTISKNNLKIIHLIKQKTSINKTALEKQQKVKVRITKEERLVNVEELVNKRIEIVKSSINKLGDPIKLLKETNGIITKQLYALKYFDDRASLTYYQKLMARFAVAIGFDQNEIAKTLSITSKHMRLNVQGKNSGVNALLRDIQWFDRCPNPDCGIVLKDYFESKIKDFQEGKPLSDIEDFELEPLIVTGYQKENLKLKQKIKKLETVLA